MAHAGELTEAYARIDLGGAEPTITVLEPDAGPALKQCLVDNLRKASYPKRGPGQSAKSVDRVPLKEMMPAMPAMRPFSQSSRLAATPMSRPPASALTGERLSMAGVRPWEVDRLRRRTFSRIGRRQCAPI